MYFGVLIMISLLKISECQTNFYGTAELVKQAQQPRRSRLLSDFTEINPATRHDLTTSISAVPSTELSTVESELDDDGPIPTVDTLKKYARIFKMDTENLNEKQRVLLQRIVQRIARLNGAQSDEEPMDLGDNEGRARKKNNKKPIAADSTIGTTNGNTKAKITASTNNNNNNGNQKKKVASSNTVSNAPIPTQPTIASNQPKVGKSKVTQANDLTLTNASSVDLGNITTTSIVDILSTDNARENFFVRRPSPASHAAVHDKVPHHKVSLLQFI